MKKLLSLFFVFTLLLSMCACGRSTKSVFESISYGTQDSASVEEESWNYAAESPIDNKYDSFESVIDSKMSIKENNVLDERKLIKTYYLDIQTLEFDSFINTLEKNIKAYNGYVESSSVSGNSINYKANRYANYTIRIPSDKVDAFLEKVNGEATITNKTENIKDITLDYVDTESRIASLQTEYDRLLELLAEAENIDTIIALESRLSEVRYQLESFKSQLRTYDNQVSYSTVDMGIAEVERVSSKEEKTVLDRIGVGLGNTFYNIAEDAKDLLVWFISNIPYFVVVLLVAVIIVLVVKLIIKKIKKRKNKGIACKNNPVESNTEKETKE